MKTYQVKDQFITVRTIETIEKVSEQRLSIDDVRNRLAQIEKIEVEKEELLKILSEYEKSGGKN